MKKFAGFERGIGIGGWLTNYKRFHCIRKEWRNVFTRGDIEHFNTYITEHDVANIAHMGFDHVRVCFDQIVLENSDGSYSEERFELLDRFVLWCERNHLNIVFNLHKAVGNYCDVADDVSLFESPILQDRFLRLWVEIERRYANKSEIAFEILNEVKWIDPQLWNELAEKTIRAIRQINPDRKIIIGCINYGNVNQLEGNVKNFV